MTLEKIYIRLSIPLDEMNPRPLDMAMFSDKAYWEMVLLNWLTRPPRQTMKNLIRPVYIWNKNKANDNNRKPISIMKWNDIVELLKWKCFPKNFDDWCFFKCHLSHFIELFSVQHPTWHDSPWHISNLIWLQMAKLG